MEGTASEPASQNKNDDDMVPLINFALLYGKR